MYIFFVNSNKSLDEVVFVEFLSARIYSHEYVGYILLISVSRDFKSREREVFKAKQII